MIASNPFEDINKRLRALELTVKKLENVVRAPAAPAAGATGTDPAPMVWPRAGAVPKALARIHEMRSELHQQMRTVQMMYDFLVNRFPGAVGEMELWTEQNPLTPSSEIEGLDIHARSSLPTEDACGDEIDEFGFEINDDTEISEEVEEAAAAPGHTITEEITEPMETMERTQPKETTEPMEPSEPTEPTEPPRKCPRTG